MGHWDTNPVDIEQNSDTRSVSDRYYPVLNINKKIFLQDTENLV